MLKDMNTMLFLASHALAAVLSITSGNPSAAAPPNVLFLICDDLNCDLACYRHPQVKSPNIDRLARRGVSFDRAYCQYPLCGPSRASLMTGLYPDQTLVRRNTIYLREHLPDVQTLPQLFRAHDYTATRIGKIYHYNVPKHIGTSGHDDPYSWDFTFNPRGRDRADEKQIFSLRPGQFGGTLSWLAAPGNDEEQTDGIAARTAVAQLASYASTGESFFLAVGLFRPHTPFVAPKKYFSMYPREKIVLPRVPETYLKSLPAPARLSLTRKKEQVNLRDNLARQAIQAYYASITFADAQIGRILNALEELNLVSNTLVVFTSDHGYHMGEHGHWQKTTLFENASRVPLIIAGPGVPSGGNMTAALAELIDIYPTLAELCGFEPPGYLSGVSLVPSLQNPQQSSRSTALTQYANGYSLRTVRYRYTSWGTEGEHGAELHDHATDRQEMINLASREHHQELAAELSAQLKGRITAAQSHPKGLEQIQFKKRRRVR